jgi:tetratricopeptide (TPR) repeat protein
MIKPNILSKIMLGLLVYVLIAPALPAQAKRELRGKVYLYETNEPVTNVTVRIEETDDLDVTTNTGMFRIFLPDGFRAGDRVTLRVDKEGYQILYPLAGEARIPAEPLKELVEVQLDQLGSHRFMSREAFNLFIEKTASEAKKQITADQERQEIDLSRYLKEWAVKYGFGFEQVRTELDKWAAEIEANQENFYELGLAAFYKKNFGEAAQKFTQSAGYHAKELQTVREREQELKAKVIRDYGMAGDAYYNDYRFQDALNAYQKALAEVDKTSDPQTWAYLMNGLSNTYWNLGMRAEGDATQQYLAQAVAGYQENLTVYTRALLPQDWAMAQNNLGNALQAQGVRTAGEAGVALLAQAVEAYRQALTVRTRGTFPQDWAATQNNLGTALQEHGVRTAGEAGAALLAQAVDAYQQALTVYTRATLPQQWATTQNNLGAALFEQGLRTARAGRGGIVGAGGGRL